MEGRRVTWGLTTNAWGRDTKNKNDSYVGDAV